ncbi:hypothetical protein OsI_03855 [Oryza sativa Indica Group]|uniref:Serpin domain-containing protein n=1 Tax=Oryza sativa subsp. indica TaxID=39946 RepID=B8AA41_ORYSI|nr:hypothetical protein OsI_03855 [Oryza sativa Indica Group]
MELAEAVRDETAMAMRLLGHLARAPRGGGGDKNLAVSPLSLHAALALLGAGARGETLDQIVAFLGPAGVRFPGLTHPGIVGTAPSAELLNIWNEREKILAETNHESIKICEVLHQRPLANLPTPENCLLGKIQEGTADWQKIANEAARTIPGRENGGNCDIKNLSRGSKVYLPVFVDGANLSTVTCIFPRDDGEVSFCGAIEMSGFLELKCEIIRGPVEPRFSDWLVFEGISVDESGKQHFLDASVAYKRAVLNAIEYLSRFGYSKEQVYLLLSCCPCEGRISGIVDSPNAVATLAIPTAIFDQDVKPKRLSGKQGPKLRRLPDVLRCSSDGHLPVHRTQAVQRHLN